MKQKNYLETLHIILGIIAASIVTSLVIITLEIYFSFELPVRLLILFSVIVGVIVGTLIMTYNPPRFQPEEMWKTETCPNCQHIDLRSDVLINKKLLDVSSHQTIKTVSNSVRNSSGNIVGTVDQQVPHTHYTGTYIYYFQCKSCGYGWTK